MKRGGGVTGDKAKKSALEQIITFQIHFVSASLQKQNLKLCYVLECLKARRDNLVKKTSGIALRKGARILNAGSFLMLGGMYVHIGLLGTTTKCKA